MFSFFNGGVKWKLLTKIFYINVPFPRFRKLMWFNLAADLIIQKKKNSFWLALLIVPSSTIWLPEWQVHFNTGISLLVKLMVWERIILRVMKCFILEFVMNSLIREFFFYYTFCILFFYWTLRCLITRGASCPDFCVIKAWDLKN